MPRAGRVDVDEAGVAISRRNRPPGSGYPGFGHFFHAAPFAEGAITASLYVP